ncbi:uncharacterized protein LOC113227016 isoform X2 [Hyposmocoma kahamanoa]|uniref:uncharacterized protein LOC113227016 isoform X2 n=1 Tax=Hyposmocoma kahamanoa TaxID=1477025 RepID=UPI000E6D7013|nr:uncharacterized protein LOC113227016 isoform X2 [Hyposmocoma kahamanoa]
MFRVCFLLLSLIAVSQQIKIAEFDVPHSVKVGENVKLKCKIEGKENSGFVMKWWFIPLFKTQNDKVQIYQRLTGEHAMVLPRFNHSISIVENDLDTLELKNAQPEHSGRYQCHPSSYYEDDIRKTSELFVYTRGSGPLLNITVIADMPDDNDTDDEVLAKCEALNVAPEPMLTIYGENGEYDETYEDRTSSVNGLYDVYKSVILSNVTYGTIYCKMSYVIFNVSDAESALFLANTTYNAPDGSSAFTSSWTLFLLATTIVQLLA